MACYTLSGVSVQPFPSGASGQVETLAEQQKALIDSIGNTQKASRFQDRTFKVFPREDRLDTIEFYRTHVYIDPQTGEEHNISVASASEALYISKSTLEGWIKNENKITAMNRGSARDDGSRYSSAVPIQLHRITHPVPFIGIEGGRACCPVCRKFVGVKPKNESPAVQKVNSLLYNFAPDYSLRQPGLRGCPPCYKELGACVSAICEHLVTSRDKVGAPSHWAIQLLLGKKVDILLPLSLCQRGSVKHGLVPDTLLLQGWTIDYDMLKYTPDFYRKSKPIFENFRLTPVLYIEDVEIPFTQDSDTSRPRPWRPRRFSPIWILYSIILHSGYHGEGAITLIYGKYTDIGSIINAIIIQALQVYFSALISKIKLLSQFSEQLEIYETSPDQKYNLEFIEEIFETAKTDSELKCHKNLVDGLKDAQMNLKYIHCNQNLYYYCCHCSEDINITDKTRNSLQHLKILYKMPKKIWFIDFAFILLQGNYSPILLQLAIRQLDGKCYVISKYSPIKYRNMKKLFRACYKGHKAKGKTSLQVRDQIVEECAYDAEDTQILSWLSSQDMQCYSRSWQGVMNVNIGYLCQKLFPGLTSKGSCEEYYTASYDTEAMAEIVQVLEDLV
ncbi:hypothetical protein BDV39DRAFT_217048 [Aspergillus sergii]|uniref:Uncharacterized protein n=1 Tax=Aspergillus sergii TaxID=1034303 RepID=A0A5N6WUE6_9EURO|nr:hypothetical protein BDV39DRAFT_217048 [Aspergillus sergii]